MGYMVKNFVIIKLLSGLVLWRVRSMGLKKLKTEEMGLNDVRPMDEFVNKNLVYLTGLLIFKCEMVSQAKL